MQLCGRAFIRAGAAAQCVHGIGETLSVSDHALADFLVVKDPPVVVGLG